MPSLDRALMSPQVVAYEKVEEDHWPERIYVERTRSAIEHAAHQFHLPDDAASLTGCIDLLQVRPQFSFIPPSPPSHALRYHMHQANGHIGSMHMALHVMSMGPSRASKSWGGSPSVQKIRLTWLAARGFCAWPSTKDSTSTQQQLPPPPPPPQTPHAWAGDSLFTFVSISCLI